MGEHTAATRRWLDQRYARYADGSYQGHQPIYGFGSPHSEPPHLPRLARTLNLLRWTVPLKPRTVLDIGGGEGYLAALLRRVTGAEPVCADLSREAARRARELFGVSSLAAEGGRLPFADRAFDVVIVSEVIEHLEDPIACLAEARRLAARWLLVTTQEAEPIAGLRRARLRLRQPGVPHTELNWWTAADLRQLLGSPARLSSQYFAMLSRDESRMSEREAVAALHRVLDVPPRTTWRGVGVMGLWSRSGDSAPPPLALEDAQVDRWARLLCSPEIGGYLARPLDYDPASTASGIKLDDGVPTYFPESPPPSVELPGCADLRRRFDPANVATGDRERWWLQLRLDIFRAFVVLMMAEPIAVKVAWLRRKLALRRGVRPAAAEEQDLD